MSFSTPPERERFLFPALNLPLTNFDESAEACGRLLPNRQAGPLPKIKRTTLYFTPRWCGPGAAVGIGAFRETAPRNSMRGDHDSWPFALPADPRPRVFVMAGAEWKDQPSNPGFFRGPNGCSMGSRTPRPRFYTAILPAASHGPAGRGLPC